MENRTGVKVAFDKPAAQYQMTESSARDGKSEPNGRLTMVDRILR